MPLLKQDLYLGIDFWKLYDLLSANLKIAEILPPEPNLKTGGSARIMRR